MVSTWCGRRLEKPKCNPSGSYSTVQQLLGRIPICTDFGTFLEEIRLKEAWVKLSDEKKRNHHLGCRPDRQSDGHIPQASGLGSVTVRQTARQTQNSLF